MARPNATRHVRRLSSQEKQASASFPPVRRARPQQEVEQSICDTWPDQVPITRIEIDIIESYLADLLEDVLQRIE